MNSRYFLSLCSVLLSSSVFAATTTIIDTNKDEKLAAVPNGLVETLTAAKIPFVKGKNGIYTVSVKNIRCESHGNGPLDSTDPQAGVRVTSCRVNTTSEMYSPKGTAIGQSIALTDRLFDADLGDCAMGGKCQAFAKSITCTVDTKIEQFHGAGRFSCVIVDEN